MIQALLNTLFHWLFTAPLLYRTVDWIMCVCEIVVVKICIDELKENKKKRKIRR